jgi:hypothetical protein
LGATQVTEDGQQILIHAAPPLTIAILPGGHNWPLLSLGEDGGFTREARCLMPRPGNC